MLFKINNDLKKISFFLRKLKKKMQQLVTDEVHLWQTVNPADNTKSVQSIDYSLDFEDMDKK